MDLIVSITGASGVIYGIRLLEELSKKRINTHLIISRWGEKNIKIETDYTINQIKNLATETYSLNDLSARLSSGSFKTDGMIVAPCSMKTLSAIACGLTDNLIIRAADVTIKQQKKLVLLPRETSFSSIHLENMLKLVYIGVVIMPPMPVFYFRPKTLDDIINHTVGRVLDCFNIEHNLIKRWSG